VTGLTEYIARFIQQESLADCPQSAPERAKKVIADTFAAMLAGANAEVTAPLLRYLDESGEQGASAVLGTSRRATPELAALINGTFGHALDFDDVLSMMPAHPSAVILAALCAEAESRPFTGRALIEAHIMRHHGPLSPRLSRDGHVGDLFSGGGARQA
jgi:2-methylcitrate dehydratase PrpD